MTTAFKNETLIKGNEMIITRFFNAPRALVWRAWSDPKHFQQWWGPKDFTCPVAKTDFRVGGQYHWCMRSAEGQEFWSTGVYREIKPQERIAYTDNFADAQGNIVPASYYSMSIEWPKDSQVTVTLEEQQGRTKMTLRHVGMPEGEHRELAGVGWNESFDKLAESLK